MINIQKSQTKMGEAVNLAFQLTQHSRDEALLRSFIKCLDCGNLYSDDNKFIFKVTKFRDIVEKIIPLFQKHPILGVKTLDFAD